MIRRLGGSHTARWVADRWERWCQVFAVPEPVHALIWVDKQLASPFRDLDSADDRVVALLTGPWQHVCLPTLVTEDTVYGPRTPAARQFLTTAARLPRARMDTLLTTRIGIDDQQWKPPRTKQKKQSPDPQATCTPRTSCSGAQSPSPN